MENDNSEVMLFCILSRINLLINYLPNNIQEDLEEAKYDIMSVLRSLGFNISLDGSLNSFMVPDFNILCNELVVMEKELTNIINMLPNYSSLEDARVSISLAIKTLDADTLSIKKPHKKILSTK